MAQLTIKQIHPYFQHRLAVQFYGILNVKELGIWEKKYGRFSWDDDIDEPRPQEIKGLKVGWVKMVNYWKDRIDVKVGVRRTKTYYDDNLDFKPILRPLSDLTREIAHRGEKFVPMKKIESFYPNLPNFESYKDVWIMNGYDLGQTIIEYCVIQQLYEWLFDTSGLIKSGLAIDVNTLENNPYEK